MTDLRLGMYVHELCGSWIDHPLWKSRFLLTSRADLQRLQNSAVQELWIDTQKGIDNNAPKNSEQPPPQASEKILPSGAAHQSAPITPSPPQTQPFNNELKQAVKLRQQSREVISKLFNDAYQGNNLELIQAHNTVHNIAESIQRNPHALISLLRIKTADEYTYMHSVAVCALMINLARHMQLEDYLVYEAGLAGLLHDLGKAAIPIEILNKPDSLTPEEFECIKYHPVAGYELLKKQQQVNESILEACLHHHEKIDGTGYPDQLKSDQITLLARMAAICDVYDAVTSNRPYKDPWSPAEAIHQMAKWRNHFDLGVFQYFVRSIGIYPIGSLVRLTSGRLAVVMEQHPQLLLLPKVKVFFCTQRRQQIPMKVLELSNAQETDKIHVRESPESWGFKNLDHLWNEGVLAPTH